MANKTDPSCHAVHSSNPQNLISKIARDKIYSSLYWKESCFGLTAESIVDKAIALEYAGGLTIKGPSDFVCLLLKLLQIQPPQDIVLEYLNNPDFKYLTVLAAVYLRLVGDGMDIYINLEPLLNDYRKIKVQLQSGQFVIEHVDEIAFSLLNDRHVFGIELPNLPKRSIFEKSHNLKPRVSLLQKEFELSKLTEDDLKAALNTSELSLKN